MDLFIGFMLGIVASIIATIFLNAIPAHRQRPFLSLLRNPRLFILFHRDTSHRRIKELIESLFQAWEEKDLHRYINCWAPNAVRVIGPNNDVSEGRNEIEEGFRQSIDRYQSIRVVSFVIDNITIRRSNPNKAIAEVHYRFQLIRQSDTLPIHEEATEFYVCSRERGKSWRIISNLDHAKDISKG